METPPVLFLIFNRKEVALESLTGIRKAKPTRLFVAADGPRPHKEGEAAKCAETRAAVLEAVDWPCEVATLLRDENLGCRRAVSGALDWFFGNVEAGIVVEDDCVLSESFYRFAAELLERYKDDERILSVCANCFPPPAIAGKESYYFSKYQHCWGWASWRRAWEKYEATLDEWDAFTASGGLKQLNERCSVFERHFMRYIDEIKNGKLSSWALQWMAAGWVNGMLNIVPTVNMSQNTGWGADSTHTFESNNWMGALPAREIVFPLTHPGNVSRNTSADRWNDVNLWHIRRSQPFIHFFSRSRMLRFAYHKIFTRIRNSKI